MKNKGVLHVITILLLIAPLPAISQNTAEYYHDLRGMVDTAEVVHLFYRHYQSWINSSDYASLNDDVVKFNTVAGIDTVFLHVDYDPIAGSGGVNDYAIFDHNPGNYIYTAYASNGVDVGTGIERCDSTGCTLTYGSRRIGVGNIGVADFSRLVYAAYGPGPRTMISTDGGYHWKGVVGEMSGPDLFSDPNPDSTIPARFLSVAPFNENLAFFDSTGSDHTILKRSKDAGNTLAVVDTVGGNGHEWQRPFYYDRDTLHVYAIVVAVRSDTTWYELRGSDKQGDAGSWQTLFQDTIPFYVCPDQGQSGVLFLAEGRNIYKFNNYGADIHLDQSSWQTLSETSERISGIYKNPGEDIVYALTDSSLLKTTSSGVYTLTHITTGIEQTVSNRKPDKYVLHHNYPNPFNPTTMIRYELAKAGLVRLTVYNVLGQQVSVLVNTRQTAGVHQVGYNASQLSSGVYFYRLDAGDHVLVKKMLLMK